MCVLPFKILGSLIACLQMRFCLREPLPFELPSPCTTDLHMAQPSRNFCKKVPEGLALG